MKNAYNRSANRIDTRKLADAIEALREIEDDVAECFDIESFESFVDRQTDGKRFERKRKEWN